MTLKEQGVSTMLGEMAGVEGLDAKDSPTSRAHILYLIDEISGLDGGGTERQVLQLIRLARRLGYDPRIAVLRGTEWLTEDIAGCPVYLAGANSLFRPSGWRACLSLARWMRRERIVLVQTFFIECNILGPWLARFAGVPVVVGSRRNLNQWQDRTRWIGPIICRLQRLANRFVDCIVANSEVVVDAMVRTEQVDPGKMRMAYNGIDLTRFSALDRLRPAARAQLGLAPGEILVGNISCMRRVKGLLQFVDAARIALQTDPNLRFLIVGDGPEQQAIQSRIQEHGIGKNIYLAGPQTDVFPFLAAMDIGVLSSLAEGFSNSLLEYMAAGLPAVATEVGGNREALAETGLLVPPDDPAALAKAILELRDPDRRRQFGSAARVRVERFSLARAEQRMEELYGELLRDKIPSPLKKGQGREEK